MSTAASKGEGIKAWFSHAFSIPKHDSFEDQDIALIDSLAAYLVGRKMTVPSLMLLESGRPLNFIGSQFLVFLSPFATMFLSGEKYARFTRILEKRGCIDVIIDRIVKHQEQRIEDGVPPDINPKRGSINRLP